MSVRGQQAAVTCVGAALLVGGALAVAVGAHEFGTARGNRDLLSPTVVRWWRDGGWGSYAAAVALGVAVAFAGVLVVRAGLRPSDGSHLPPTITLVDNDTEGSATKGVVTVRSGAVVRGVRHDLERLEGVRRAAVALVGVYPDLEMRAVLDLDLGSDLQVLTKRVEARLARLNDTAGVKLRSARINVRLRQVEPRRQLT